MLSHTTEVTEIRATSGAAMAENSAGETALTHRDQGVGSRRRTPDLYGLKAFPTISVWHFTTCQYHQSRVTDWQQQS